MSEATQTRSRNAAPVDAENAESEDKNVGSIGMRIPLEMKTMVEEKAKAAGISVRGYAARVLAADVGFTGELAVGKAKDDQMSPEAKKEKNKAVRAAKTKVFQDLLSKYDQVAEVLQLTDEQKKLLGIG